MNHPRRLARVLSGALLIASSAFAASDYLLELDAVDGDVGAGHQTIEVQSFSWGATNAGSVEGLRE